MEIDNDFPRGVANKMRELCNDKAAVWHIQGVKRRGLSSRFRISNRYSCAHDGGRERVRFVQGYWPPRAKGLAQRDPDHSGRMSSRNVRIERGNPTQKTPKVFVLSFRRYWPKSMPDNQSQLGNSNFQPRIQPKTQPSIQERLKRKAFHPRERVNQP